MFYLPCFTEFSNNSYGQAFFSHFFMDAQVLTITSIGAEMVSNLFTAVFPGASTGPAYDTYLINVW